MSQESPLIRLVYVSRNKMSGPPRAVSEDISAMLSKSRLRNVADAVTGALMFNSGRFAQVLEGPVAAVDALFARIAADPRHDQVVVVEQLPIDARAFAAWSMAYVGPDGMHDIPLSPSSAPGAMAQSVLARLREEIRTFEEHANFDGA